MSKDEVNYLVIVWLSRTIALAYVCVFIYNFTKAVKLFRMHNDEWVNNAWTSMIMLFMVIAIIGIYLYWQLPDHPLPR